MGSLTGYLVCPNFSLYFKRISQLSKVVLYEFSKVVLYEFLFVSEAQLHRALVCRNMFQLAPGGVAAPKIL
jgi:hypothetical protein